MNDIDTEISHGFASSYADDTKIMHTIKEVIDMQNLQNDLSSVYSWSDFNNMVLNDTKFELLQYGGNSGLKSQCNYLTPAGIQIEPKTSTKDLGIYMSTDLSFSCHINNTVSSIKDLSAWALRTFVSRSKLCMMTIWKSLVLPRLDYGSQIWCSIKKCDINSLELLQRNFIKRVHSLRELTYWEQLINLRLFSIQRRHERYRIIYLWKIFEGIVPNPYPICLYVKSDVFSRLGRMCYVPSITNNMYKSLQLSSFSYHAATLFNCLPKSIRNTTGCGVVSFKNTLDQYLKTVPDEPQIPGYTNYRRAESNSIIDMKRFA